jgi:predicted acetyltransferase
VQRSFPSYLLGFSQSGVALRLPPHSIRVTVFMIQLEAASLAAPVGLEGLLADLGGGECGFGGTPVHTGEATLQEYLQQCCDMPDPALLAPGLVPQTIFWVLKDDGEAIGMMRVRHYLNDSLLLYGGHVGYYIRRDQRGKGYAKAALRLALNILRELGEPRALLTVNPDNTPSIRVIEGCGGCLENVVTSPETGKVFKRYWVELMTDGVFLQDLDK